MNSQNLTKARATLDAIYAGDDDRAAQLLAQISEPQPIDIAEIQRAADAAVGRRALQDSLREKYPAAFDDRDLALIADRRYHAHLAAGRSEDESAELAAAEAVAKLPGARSPSSRTVNSPLPKDPDPSATIQEMRAARGQV